MWLSLYRHRRQPATTSDRYWKQPIQEVVKLLLRLLERLILRSLVKLPGTSMRPEFPHLEAIIFAVAEHVLPFIRNTFGTQERGLNTKVDLQSSGLHRNSEVENSKNTEICPKTNSNLSNGGRHVKERELVRLS